MATERELKTMQEAVLYDILKLMHADNEKEMRALLKDMYARAQSGMTIEEVEAVKYRIAVSKEN